METRILTISPFELISSEHIKVKSGDLTLMIYKLIGARLSNIHSILSGVRELPFEEISKTLTQIENNIFTYNYIATGNHYIITNPSELALIEIYRPITAIVSDFTVIYAALDSPAARNYLQFP